MVQVEATDPDGDSNALEYRLVEGQYPATMDLEVIDDDLERGRYARVTWVPEEPSATGYWVAIEVGEPGWVNGMIQGFYLPVTTALPPNDPPEFLTPSLGPMVKDCLFDFVLDVEDPNGHAIAGFEVVPELTTAPGFSSANIDASGHIQWTPTAGGPFEVTIRATDEHGAAETVTYPIYVVPNANPKIEAGAASPAFLGMAFAYSVTITDPNAGDDLTVTLNEEATAAGLYLAHEADGDIWTLTWDEDDVGPVGAQVLIRIEVQDDQGGWSRMTLTLPVYDPDDPNAPQVLGPDGEIEIPAGREFHFQVAAQGAPRANLSFALEPCEPTLELPLGISIDCTGLITWTPTLEQAGPADGGGIAYHLRAVVDDDLPNTAPVGPLEFTLIVLRPEDFEPAVLKIESMPPTGATAGQELVYEPQATGTGAGLRWFLDAKPTGMNIDEETGRITWTPESSRIGHSVEVRLRVVGPTGAGWVQPFLLAVGGVNQAPVIESTFPLSWRAGEPLAFNVVASDAEGHALVYELLSESGEPLPNSTYGISIDEAGRIEWAAPVAGYHPFVVRVAEKHRPSSQEERTFWLHVVDADVNVEPILIGSPHGRYATVGQEFAFQFSALDLDTDNGGFTWAIAEGDLGDHMDIDSSGLFTWTPQAGETGQKTVKVRLTDVPATGLAATTFVTFTLTGIVNLAPEIAPVGELHAVAGTVFVHPLEFRDPEGGPLSFAIDTSGGGVPEYLLVHPTQGYLWWDIPADSPAATYGVPVVATDEYGASATRVVTIHVSTTDTIAPTISVRVFDAAGNLILPGEELDVEGSYWACIKISDNAGEAALDSAAITVVDVAAFELPLDYYPVHGDLGYGTTWVEFTVNGLNQGNIHFEIVASDVSGNEATTTFTYYAADTSQNPPAKILEFRDGENKVLGVHDVITDAVDVYGIANMGSYSYELILYRADGAYYSVVPEDGKYILQSDAEYVVVAPGEANSNLDRNLGSLDPTLYGSGMYRLVLAIICDCGGHHYKAVDERIIEIRNDARPGSLDLSFTDLQVDLGGIPVSLVRSYSSAQVDLGTNDFGPGWSLAMLGAGVQVAHFEKATNTLREPMARGTRIFVTLPDGTIQRFTFDPLEAAGGQYWPYFRPDPDVTGTLDILGMDESLLLLPLGEQGEGAYKGPYVTANGNEDFTPHRFGSAFVLRTQDGLEYLYDLESGELAAIQNDAGRRIDVSTDGGVTTIKASSEDQTITITRDGDGRVIAISDPSGASLAYAYGEHAADGVFVAEGENLGKVTLRDGSRVVYRYTDTTFEHHLSEIYDNAGVGVLTVEFDAEGRLDRLVDASGHATDVSFNMTLGGGLSLTRVDLGEGRIAAEIRDSRGNLVRTAQSLDSNFAPELQQYLVTVYRYNMQGLLTHQSMPFVVSGAANRYTQEPAEPDADPTAWARLIEYDSKGRMTRSTDALGNVTTYDFDTAGRLVATTDPMGNVTHNVYDTYTGNLVETFVTEGSGVGGQGSEKLNHTRYEYNWYGQLTAVYRVPETGPEILVSSFTYEEFSGRLASSTDAAGLARYFVYDYNGNQTLVCYQWEDPNDGDEVVDGTVVSRTDYDVQDRAIGTSQYEINGAATYTSAGQLDSETPLWTTSTHYNSRGLVDRTIDQFGRETWTFYDARGLVIETLTEAEDGSVTPAAQKWLVTRTVYDDRGRAIYSADPVAIDYFTITDTTSHTPAAAAAAYGTHSGYDAFGRATTSEELSGLWVELYVGAEGQWSSRLATGHTPTVICSSDTFYDDLGRVQYTLDVFGSRSEYTYDALGRQLESRYQSKDAGGDVQWVATRTVYDALGRPLITSDSFIRQPDGSMRASYGTLSSYDSLGRAVKTEHLSGLVIDISDPDEPTWTATGVVWSTETVYDNLGQVAQSIGQHAPQGTTESEEAYAARLATVTTDYEYDVLGRQTAQVAPVVTDDSTGELVRLRSETHYDSQGRAEYTSTNIRVVVDEEGVVQSTSYADAQETHYGYDAYGRRTLLTDPEGNTTTWIFNGLGLCLEETNPLQATEHFAYDDFGRLASKTDRNGRVTTYLYDAFSRQVEENWLDAQQNIIETFSYTYDEEGRLLSASDSTATYTYGYDAYSRATSITIAIVGLAPTVLFTQEFDDYDNRIGLSAAIGGTDDFTNDYAYNAFGQLVMVQQHGRPGGSAVAEKRIDFGYTSDWLPETLTRYADLAAADLVATSTYGYDLLGQLTSLAHAKGAGMLAGYTWTFDSTGRMTQATSTIDGTVDYTSDLTGQLTGADYDSAQTDEDYSYDANGNRTNSGYVTGANNQFLSDGTYRYAYDAEGSRIARFVDADQSGSITSGDTDIITYLWDHRNRLTKVSDYADYAAYMAEAPGQVVEYAYDHANRLVRKVLDSDGDGTADFSSVYVFDGDQIALQFDDSGTGDAVASDLSHRYLWGAMVDQILADEQVADLETPGDVLWPLTDHLGSVRSLAVYDDQTDETTIANHRVYNAFGALESQTNAAVDSIFGYTGRQFDSDTGLQNNLNRWYDPAVGRWTSEDPIGFDAGDMNLNRYVGNQPTMLVDPSGLLLADPLEATTIGIQIDLASIGFSLYFASLLGMRLFDLQSQAEAQRLAVQLDTEVLKDTDIDRDPGYRYFVHGTNSGAWGANSTQIDARSGKPNKDFGLGFYAFEATPDGIFAAKSRAEDVSGWRGGFPFLLVVRMQTGRFNSLKQRTFPGARTPGSPGELDYLTFVNKYRKGYNAGITGYDVVWGPVATRKWGTSQWIVNPKYPDQYKFETHTAISQLEIVGIIPFITTYLA